MPRTLARRDGSGLPMPLSSTLMRASRVALSSLPAAHAIARMRRSTATWSYGSVCCIAARARAITPVPGGVGPMTIAMLLRNTLTAARRRRSGVAVSGV